MKRHHAVAKRSNLFGFGKKTTYSTGLLAEAYSAGHRSGDTSRFKEWAARQDNLSGGFKKQLEKRYRAGVESLWHQEERAKKKEKAEAKRAEKTEKAEAKRQAGKTFGRYRGVRLIKFPGGRYALATDRDSKFDDLRQAKRYVDSELAKSNPPPGPKKNRTGRRYIVQVFTDNVGWVKLGTIRARSKADALDKAKARFAGQVRPGSRLRVNPPKFDRCVADVKASLAKYHRPGNAYAICTAAGTRNPQTAKQLRASGWRLVDTFKQRVAAEAITGNYKPFRLVSRSGKWEVWTKQPGANVAKKQKRNYQAIVWTAKQGRASADVYKTGSGYEIEFSDGQTAQAKSFQGARAIARLRLHEIASNPVPPEVSVVPGASYADTLVRAAQRVTHGVTKSTKGLLKKVGLRKNPVDIAVKRYEEFHGFPVNEINEVESKVHRHSVTYGLARLVALNVLDVNGKQLPPLIAPGFKFSGPAKFAYVHFGNDGDLLSPEQTAERFKIPPEELGYWAEHRIDAGKIVWLTAGEDNKQLLFSGGDQSLDLKELGFSERDWHDSMFIGTILRVWYRTRKKFEGDEEVDFYHDFGKEGSRGVYPLLAYKPKDPSMEIVGGRYEIAKPDSSLGNISPGIVG